MSNRSNSETSNLKVFLKCREFPGIPFGHLGCAKVSGSRVSFSKHGHTTEPSRSSWDPQFSQGPNSDIPMYAVMWNDVNVADATRVSFKSGSSADPKPGQKIEGSNFNMKSETGCYRFVNLVTCKWQRTDQTDLGRIWVSQSWWLQTVHTCPSIPTKYRTKTSRGDILKLVDFKIPPPEKPVLMASASGRSASEPKSPKCSWMAWTKTSSQQMSCQLQVGDGKRPTGSWSRSVHHYTVPYRLTIIWCDRRVNKLEGSHKLHRSIQNDDVDTCIVSTWIVEENCDVPCQDRSNDTHPSTQQESSKYTIKHKPKVPLTLKQLNMRLVRTKLTRHSDFSSSFSLAETTRCCLSPCFSQGFNPAWEQDA